MGFLGSLFSAQNNYNQTAPQSNYVGALGQDLGQVNQTTGQQQQLAQTLQQQIQGGGPNLAQTQLQSATQQANQQAAGLIGAQRGMSPALAARQILNQQAANTQGAANQSAQLQQQQQLAAQGQLAGVLAQQGQLENQQVGTLGQLSNQQNQLNLQAQTANQQAANNAFNPLGALSGLGQGATSLGGTLSNVAGGAAGYSEGGQVDAMVSPGERIFKPGENYDDGGMVVPGDPRVPGDSPTNDTVPASLPVGSVVVPRTKAMDPVAVKNFMEAIRNPMNPRKNMSYGGVVKAREKMDRMK